MYELKVVIVTGLSGAGKTQAVWSLEDLGFFCVDNLPPTLIPKFTELCLQSQGAIEKIALVIDIRGGNFFDKVFETLDELKQQGIKYEILFLEASNETLVRRFKETRRRHPLNPQGRVLEGIIEERTRLEDLRGRATKIIDTSDMSNNQLKEELIHCFDDHHEERKLRVNILSFGFKYGIPLDADLVIDVRFLPNPHYDPDLKPLTGHNGKVQEFVYSSKITYEFMEKFVDLIKFLIPQYISEGKTNLTIAVGCTGGQHRSVTVALKLEEALAGEEATGYRVVTKHRDTQRNLGVIKK